MGVTLVFFFRDLEEQNKCSTFVGEKYGRRIKNKGFKRTQRKTRTKS